MVSVSVTVLEKVSGGLMSCDHEEVAEIREREGDMVRNQAEVLMSIVDGTREWTLSCETRTKSASKENRGENPWPFGAAAPAAGLDRCFLIPTGVLQVGYR